MTFTRDFFAFLSYTAVIMVFQCKADCLPPPTGLEYKWLDAFTVNVSWKKPSDLPDGSVVRYKLWTMKNGTCDVGKHDENWEKRCTEWTYFIDTFLTEQKCSDSWTYLITTVGNESCDSPNESTPASISISKPRAEVVKDFKCFPYAEELNCSWVPVNQSHNLTLSYRLCGDTQERIKSLKVCDRPYSSGKRNGCFLKAAVQDDIYILVESEAGRSTFKPVLVVPSPELTIRERGDNLEVSWKPPEVGKLCSWTYEVNYSKCSEPKELSFTVEEGREHTMQVAYDKSCRYEFQSRVKTTKYCKTIFSDFGEVVTYGTNEPPDRTLTVVAIVMPIILSACVMLSCYCFRRHRTIICPIIPDPSAIFKEMMMNGNKELMTTTGSLYTPVPEPIEPCKITLETKNTVFQQNS